MMVRGQLLLLGFALSLVGPSAAAQTPELPLAHWQHSAWTGDRAPPAQSGEGMERSNDGFLWLGGRGGIVRFDGTGFVLFDSTRVPALKGLPLCCYVVMPVGPSGTMRVLGPDGLLLGYRDGRFRVELPRGSGLDGAVMEDRLGRLWGLTDRLRLIKDGHFEAPPLPAGVPDTGIIGYEPDSGNGILIGTGHAGLWHVNGDRVEHIGTGWLRAALQSADGTIWTVGARTPYRDLGRIRSGVWSPVLLPDGVSRLSARSMREGPDGSVWIPTNREGLLRWHEGKMERYSTQNGLSSDFTADVYATKEGTVWVATDAGLDRLRPAELTLVDGAGELPRDMFAVDGSGAVWITSTNTPLIRLAGGLFQYRPGQVIADSSPVSPHGASLTLTPSRTGGVWLAPLDGGLIRTDGRDERFFGRANGLPVERILRGVEDPEGTLWVMPFGREFGRFRAGRYRRFPLPDGDRPGPFLLDGFGRLCVASRTHPAIYVVSHDSILDEVPLPLGDRGVPVSVALEGGDTLWATTENALVRIVGRQARAVLVPELAKLFDGGAWLAVSRGQAWLASSTGMARISLRELHRAADGGPGAITPVVFDALDGIATPRAAGALLNAIRVGPDGRVWIMTADGLAVADGPRSVRNPDAPRIIIDRVTLGGRPVALEEVGTLEADPGQLTIELSIPDLVLPERMQVEYQLEGADSGWVRATPPFRASYDRLRPGRYRFRGRGWNESGIPTPDEATLTFRVLAAWYQSWWFFGLCALGVAGLAAGATQVLQRGRNQRMMAAARDRFDAVLTERARLARELHDTLLQGFTGITLQLDGVRDSLAKGAHPLAQELSQILLGADRSLREAREMVWDIRQPGIPESEFGDALRSTCGTLPNPEGIPIEHVVTGVPRALAPGVATTLLRVGKEATFNAINHSQARMIIVTLCYEPHGVRLEVQDNGRGATVEQLEAMATARGHWGLAGMRERTQNAGGTLTVDSTPGRGTRITVSLPTHPQS